MAPSSKAASIPRRRTNLSRAEVVIIYKGDAGYMTPQQHQNLIDYVSAAAACELP